ncbi:MAG TPA: hypothetical protein VK983_00660, partial [Candidatus Limnocylindrales bacterium]|nr:hypothetical protein [Candidatus Limnocylindrales bacterium]
TAPSVIKAQTRTDILAKVPVQTVVPKKSHASVDHKRLRRAERIIQSPAVSKYSQTRTAVMTTAAHKQPATHIPAAIKQPQASTLQPTPVRSELRAPAAAYKAIQRPQRAPVAAPAQQLNSDIFEQALAEATSHKQTYAPKRRGRIAGFATAAFLTLLLVGFIGYQNKPYIEMKIASSKAGIQATMPGYNPTGFTFGNLAYSTDDVTLNYFSKSDPAQSYKIVQKASDWNSASLLDNFVMSTTKSYQTIERAGRTIYLYGDNTATWVDNGIWYTINGNQSLTSTQLLDLAGSL